MAKLEELAVELESIHDRHDELLPVVAHARDDAFPRDALLQELLDARLGFFAHKLATHYYDNHAEEFAKGKNQDAVDVAAETIAKESLEQAEAHPVPTPAEKEKKEEVPAKTQTSQENPVEPAPVEPAPEVPTPDAPPAQDQVSLPHCPSCAGFHVSHTEEHPYQIPDQKM